VNMKERGIIFNTEMVRAILEDRKTNTRRVINPQPDHFHKFKDSILRPQIEYKEIECPYGKIGDLLYVRETYTKISDYSGGRIISKLCYKADNGLQHSKKDAWGDLIKWKPSIHMPKSAARIWLEITDIRVERLQDINELEIIKEGCPNLLVDEDMTQVIEWWVDLWDSINEKRGYGWDVNPWVWAIEFKKRGYI
jgi:hypothetical protein